MGRSAGYAEERAAVPACDAQAPRCAEGRRYSRHVPKTLYGAAAEAWDEAVTLGEAHGFRNAQATVLAPTGTIGFMMDCDTTGVEPDIALVKYKKLVDGGMMKIVNQTVPTGADPPRLRRPAGAGNRRAHRRYTTRSRGRRTSREEDLPVFDCAFKPAAGDRFIHYMGHIKHDRRDPAVHLGGHLEDDQRADRRDGSRISSRRTSTPGGSVPRRCRIYRDGSKRTQPLNTSRTSHTTTPQSPCHCPANRCVTGCRTSVRRSRISSTSPGHEGYITVGPLRGPARRVRSSW